MRRVPGAVFVAGNVRSVFGSNPDGKVNLKFASAINRARRGLLQQYKHPTYPKYRAPPTLNKAPTPPCLVNLHHPKTPPPLHLPNTSTPQYLPQMHHPILPPTHLHMASEHPNPSSLTLTPPSSPPSPQKPDTSPPHPPFPPSSPPSTPFHHPRQNMPIKAPRIPNHMLRHLPPLPLPQRNPILPPPHIHKPRFAYISLDIPARNRDPSLCSTRPHRSRGRHSQSSRGRQRASV